MKASLGQRRAVCPGLPLGLVGLVACSGRSAWLGLGMGLDEGTGFGVGLVISGFVGVGLSCKTKLAAGHLFAGCLRPLDHGGLLSKQGVTYQNSRFKLLLLLLLLLYFFFFL